MPLVKPEGTTPYVKQIVNNRHKCNIRLVSEANLRCSAVTLSPPGALFGFKQCTNLLTKYSENVKSYFSNTI